MRTYVRVWWSVLTYRIAAGEKATGCDTCTSGQSSSVAYAGRKQAAPEKPTYQYRDSPGLSQHQIVWAWAGQILTPQVSTHAPPPPLPRPPTPIPGQAVPMVETRWISANPCACTRTCVRVSDAGQEPASTPAGTKMWEGQRTNREADIGSGASCGRDWRPPCSSCVTTTNVIAPITGCGTDAPSLRRPVPRGQGQATNAVLGLGGAAASSTQQPAVAVAAAAQAARSCGRM